MAIHAEDITVDRKDQLEKIEGVCLPDETIRAVFFNIIMEYLLR